MFKSFGKTKDLGMLIPRLAIGSIFILVYGWSKITNPSMWGQLGGAMKNLGITWYPEFWGFMAAFAEVAGAICLILGFLFRPAALIMAFDMFVATLFHFSKHDPWMMPAVPIAFGCMFLAFFFIGPGKFSIDELIYRSRHSKVNKPIINPPVTNRDILRPRTTAPAH